MGGSVVPLLKVERLGKPFEGVIAMRDTSFEPEAETADALCGGDGTGEAVSALLTKNRGRAFAGGEAPGPSGRSTSKRSS